MIRAVAATVAFCVLTGAVAVRALRAQETATLMPPPAWIARPVDTPHHYAFERMQTVNKWTPAKKPTDVVAPAGTIYFAVGDAGGRGIDSFAGAVVAAIPPAALHASTKVKLCGDTDLGWLFEYDDPHAKVSIDRAVAVHDVVAAIATYERPIGSPEDPVARASLLTLCAASEPAS